MKIGEFFGCHIMVPCTRAVVLDKGTQIKSKNNGWVEVDETSVLGFPSCWGKHGQTQYDLHLKFNAVNETCVEFVSLAFGC